MNPRVSVIMPVYNGELYVREAINSLLRQTFADFELIIINDGSTDLSAEIIKSFKDERIVVINNEKNVGLSTVRNRGLEIARSEFIAFMDCDDISLPERLEFELDFLEKHQDFGLVGSFARLIDKNNVPTGVAWKEFVTIEKFQPRILFGNMFVTSSVMLRKTALPKTKFSDGFAPAEDYELWGRIMKNWKGWNIPKILINYRTHSSGTSVTKKAEQQKSINRIITTDLREIGIEPTEEELSIHRKNYGHKGTDNETKKFIDDREKWLLKLFSVNENNGHFPKKIFAEVIVDRFLSTLETNARLGFYVWKKFWTSPISKETAYNEPSLRFAKFYIKCLLRKDSLR